MLSWAGRELVIIKVRILSGEYIKREMSKAIESMYKGVTAMMDHEIQTV